MSNIRIKQFIQKTLTKRELEAQLTQIKEEIRLMEPQVTEIMASEGLKNLSFKNLGMAYLQRELFAGLRKGPDGTYSDAHKALQDMGLDHLLENGVKEKQLTAYVREMHELDGIPAALEPHIRVTEVIRPRVKA